MKIEIIKLFKLLEVGQKLDIDMEYSANLIKNGFAKSLEKVEEADKTEEKPKKKKEESK